MHQQRLANVRQQLSTHMIDCLALVPGFNLHYLTGVEFFLLERPFLAFIPANENMGGVVVIPALEAPAWERAVPFEATLFPWTDDSGPDEAMRQAAKKLAGITTLGVEFLRMRVQEQELISRSLPNVRIVKGETALHPVRIRKDSAEVESLRRAVHALETALENVVSSVEPGMTEREICNRLTSAILQSGGEIVAMEPLVQSGPNAALPHGRTGDRRVGAGDMLLVDFTTTVGGYYADMTRTFVVGKEPDKRLCEVYAAVHAANAAGREAIQPGVSCQDIDRAARKAIVEAGFGEYFIHRTGHGLGLDVHEPPGIVEGNEMLLEEGMVFTIEPGVYIDGWGGVRIEDNVVVTSDGHESLTTFDRELRVIGT